MGSAAEDRWDGVADAFVDEAMDGGGWEATGSEDLCGFAGRGDVGEVAVAEVLEEGGFPGACVAREDVDAFAVGVFEEGMDGIEGVKLVGSERWWWCGRGVEFHVVGVDGGVSGWRRRSSCGSTGGHGFADFIIRKKANKSVDSTESRRCFVVCS